jgi:adiponectin receptor
MLDERNLFFLLIYSCCFFCFVTLLVMKFDRKKFARLTGPMFIVCGLMAAVPLNHINKNVDKEFLDEIILYPWALGGLIYIVGALIYMFKIPERFYPRTFDNFVSNISLQ